MNRRLAALSAVAVLLGGYLLVDNVGWLPFGGSGDAPLQNVASGSGAASARLNPLQGLDPVAYPDIVDRPLFNPSRQPRPAAPPPLPAEPVTEAPPPEPPPPPPPAGPSPEDYKLLGVASGQNGRIAAIRIAASGEVVYLRKDESVDSWRIIDIGDRSVAIGTPDNAVTYRMFDNAAAGDGQDPAEPVDGVPAGAAPPQQQQPEAQAPEPATPDGQLPPVNPDTDPQMPNPDM